MNWIDVVIIGSYLILLVFLSVWKRGNPADEVQFLLSGRKLSLPALIGTLVSTWYGGILGIGEYSYQYGISQWLIFGVPYYFFAILFALFLAQKIRDNPALTIPEAVQNVYGKPAARASALSVFLLVNPAPYLLMIGLLVSFFLGYTGSNILVMVLAAIVVTAYIWYGGFSAVVKTDILQVLLMFGGFYMLLGFAWSYSGSPIQVLNQLPDLYSDPTGGHSTMYILVWFFIAMWTFIDPSFHQRCTAAKNGSTAKKGIILSVLFWLIFDLATLTTALYGRFLLGALENPAMVYPLLAELVLPEGLRSLFFLALLATIMSTLDSYLFLSGQTLGRDFLSEWSNKSAASLSRIGIIISAVLGIILAIIFPSVISLWYVIGSIIIPGLLIPVLGLYLHFFRVQQKAAVWMIIIPSATSLNWLIAGIQHSGELYSYAFWGIEPFYPGIFCSMIMLAIFRYRHP